MRRFQLALRVLLGKPLYLDTDDGTVFTDPGSASDSGSSERPPFDLVLGGIVEFAPPLTVIGEGDFRVCVFRDREAACEGCGNPLLWLVLELKMGDKWAHLAAMHERHLPEMLAVLARTAAFLEAPSSRAPKQRTQGWE